MCLNPQSRLSKYNGTMSMQTGDLQGVRIPSCYLSQSSSYNYSIWRAKRWQAVLSVGALKQGSPLGKCMAPMIPA